MNPESIVITYEGNLAALMYSRFLLFVPHDAPRLSGGITFFNAKSRTLQFLLRVAR